MINNFFIEEDEHYYRFFRTKWNSPVSVLKYKDRRHPQYGLKFRDGYCELHFGSWRIRYRNGK